LHGTAAVFNPAPPFPGVRTGYPDLLRRHQRTGGEREPFGTLRRCAI